MDNHNYTIKKSYRGDDKLRKSFNELAGRTFGLNFEDWHQKGYWKDGYIPYSVVLDGRVVANVSVNVLEFDAAGSRKTLIQLGTVMTDKEFRNQGLIRRLMAEVEKDYDPAVYDYFLFANDSVLDFYPKFGFRQADEYQYSKEVNCAGSMTAVQVSMEDETGREQLERAVAGSVPNSSLALCRNVGLIMFYATKFMKECVYCIDNDIYAIAEKEKDDLLIHDIFAAKAVDLDEVIRAFGDVRTVTLGFTPLDRSGYTVSKVDEEDTTLFVRGGFFGDYEKRKVMFPTLSRA